MTDFLKIAKSIVVHFAHICAYGVETVKLMGGVNFWLLSRSGDENCYHRTLSICLKLRISIVIDQQ